MTFQGLPVWTIPPIFPRKDYGAFILLMANIRMHSGENTGVFGSLPLRDSAIFGPSLAWVRHTLGNVDRAEPLFGFFIGFRGVASKFLYLV